MPTPSWDTATRIADDPRDPTPPRARVTVVIDASVVVAALVDGGPVGSWAEELLVGEPLAAPHLLPVEVANILRRSVLAGQVSADVAGMAHHDLLGLRVELFAYEPFGPRAWELRANVTAYDAWYVALAEQLGSPLATLDRRLRGAAGPRCDFLIPG
jgi:predicted nucleic acid-binding protein